MAANKTTPVPYEIAVLIPCFNEEATVGKVVTDFKAALPDAVIYVYDNNSTDRTVSAAKNAGAVVRRESLQGKGNVLRRMFADIEAEIYVMVDGDDTYHAPAAPIMIAHLIDEQLDMVNGARITDIKDAYRFGHKAGNRILSNMVAYLFGERIKDVLSGFRVFSRRYVKSFPALSSGFEIETELTVHALELRMKVAELDTPYKNRPEGSVSKLSTVRDGYNILRTIVTLIKIERPLPFFTASSAVLAAISIILAVPVFIEYLRTGLVARFPTAILCSALMLLAFLGFYAGLILDTITTGRREVKRFAYLSVPIFQIRDYACGSAEREDFETH